MNFDEDMAGDSQTIPQSWRTLRGRTLQPAQSRIGKRNTSGIAARETDGASLTVGRTSKRYILSH